jgi:hypothetical protein
LRIVSIPLYALLLSLFPFAAACQTISLSANVAVGPQYDTTHVYVSPDAIDSFTKSFLGTFGGTSTKPMATTVTPAPSSTISELLQTPVGKISLFGFTTPIPAPFGAERNGYLVQDMDTAIQAARVAGADVIVAPFKDPIGVDAIVQWPGGVNMQLYWHTKPSSSPPLESVPENRVYVSPDRADAFIRSFVMFSHGRVLSDEPQAPGIEIGTPNAAFRRIQIESAFGKMLVLVTNGFLPFPYGRETTGYEVANLSETLARARSFGVTVLVEPFTLRQRTSAIVQFPGGYIAEIHASITGSK